jgi:LysM repeat protein
LVGSDDVTSHPAPSIEILEEETHKDLVLPDVPVISEKVETENVDTHVAIRPSSAKIHIVKEGDTLYNLSKKYGLTISYLKKINNLTNDIIKVDQELKIN